jgi:hypothetical protein
MSAVVLSLPGVRSPATAIGRARVSSDPIFDVIAEHRAALWARWAALTVSGSLVAHDPRLEKADARTGAAWDREREALEELLACRPTTMGGLVNLIAYVGQPEDDDDDDRPPQSETIISGAFRSGRISAEQWTRRLSKDAERLLKRGRSARPAVDEAGSPR